MALKGIKPQISGKKKALPQTTLEVE